MAESISDDGKLDPAKVAGQEESLAPPVQPVVKLEDEEILEMLQQAPDTGQTMGKEERQEQESVALEQEFTIKTDSETVDNEGSTYESDKSDEHDSDNELEGDTLEESALSVHISPDERAMFDDGSHANGDNQALISPATAEDADSIKTHSILSEGSVDDTKEETEEEEELYERKSDLHCALCGEFCTDGRLLKCLHTFCLHCLEKRTKEIHKFLFCPLCKFRTIKPKVGLHALPKNHLVSKLIEAESTRKLDKDCVVCKLVGEDSVGVARCLDCGDLLCQDCSSKHTYSRLTAKHTVVSVGAETSDGEEAYLSVNRVMYCHTHRDEEVKFYCNKCEVGVCRDCILLAHSSHSCISLNDAYTTLSDHIQRRVKQLKEQAEELKDEDYEKDLSEVEEEERREIKCLEDAKAEIIKAVEGDFNNCFKILEKEFDKQREHCLGRKKYVEKTKQGIYSLEENISFILKWGGAVEIIAMEKTLNETFADHEKNIKWVNPTIQTRKHFPKVHINRDKIKMLSNLSWCNVLNPHGRDTSQPLGASRKMSESLDGKENQSKSRRFSQRKAPQDGNTSNNAVRSGQSRTGRANNSERPKSFTAVTPGSSGMSASQQNMAGPRLPSFGRGKHLQSISAGSLLGEYPGHLKNLGTSNSVQGVGSQHPKTTLRSNGFGQLDHPAGNSMGSKNQSSSEFTGGIPAGKAKQALNRPEQTLNRSDNYAPQNPSSGRKHPGKDRKAGPLSPYKDNLVSTMGRDVIRLRLRTSVKVSVVLEQYEPEVAGIAFTSPQAFAITDCRNKRVKLFDVGGKFLTVIEDVDPMAVTACKDHLIWNSNFSDIMIYSIPMLNKLDCRIFNVQATHPVATFKGEKLLVANVQGSTVEAYQDEGSSYKWMHSLQPVDGHGHPLRNVSQVAAFSRDQLALVDKALRKVIITNFDGRFIGEYSCSGWEPGGVCIDHKNTIFVTDRARNKLVALTSNGEFIQEWKTLVDLPSAVACNGKGLVIVGGRGSNVSVYQYD